jgi:hypothetical protein
MGMKPFRFPDPCLCVGFSGTLIGSADGKKMKSRGLAVEADEEGMKKWSLFSSYDVLRNEQALANKSRMI